MSKYLKILMFQCNWEKHINVKWKTVFMQNWKKNYIIFKWKC